MKYNIYEYLNSTDAVMALYHNSSENMTLFGKEDASASVTTGYFVQVTSSVEIIIHDVSSQVSTGRVLIGVTLFFIVFLTIAGNLMVFLAVIFTRKLRSVSNMFIVSLSLADIMVGTFVMIPGTLNEIFQEWTLADSFCVVWAGFDVMLCSASILNVCLISLDRYISIMSPLRYKMLVTYRRALFMLALAWGIAMCASFIPLLTGIHNPELPSLTNLTLLTERPQCLFIPSLLYVLIASTVTILLPIIVAIVLYYRVSKEAKRQACFVGILITPSNMLLGSKMANKHIREPFTRKATITLGIIVGAYVVTWAPFLVANLTDAICKCVPPKVFSAIVWLGWCNSLINPIIYPFFMRDFRKVYTTTFFKICPCAKLFQKVKRDRIFFRDPADITKSSQSKSNYGNSDDRL